MRRSPKKAEVIDEDDDAAALYSDLAGDIISDDPRDEIYQVLLGRRPPTEPDEVEYPVSMKKRRSRRNPDLFNESGEINPRYVEKITGAQERPARKR